MREYRGLAIAIAAIVLLFAGSLGALLLVLSWIGVTGYAGFKMVTGGADDDPNAAGIIVGVVVLVSTLTLLAAIGIRFVGKGMEPAKRSADDAF